MTKEEDIALAIKYGATYVNDFAISPIQMTAAQLDSLLTHVRQQAQAEQQDAVAQTMKPDSLRKAREHLGGLLARYLDDGVFETVADASWAFAKEYAAHIQADQAGKMAMLADALQAVEVVGMHYEESSNIYFTCPECEFNKASDSSGVKHAKDCMIKNALSATFPDIQAYRERIRKEVLEEAANNFELNYQLYSGQDIASVLLCLAEKAEG